VHGEAPALREGSRNAALTSLAGSMRRRGMSEEAMAAALLEENRLRCRPPLPEDEVRQVARSVARYEPDADSAVDSRQAALADRSATIETGSGSGSPVFSWGSRVRFSELVSRPRQSVDDQWLVRGILAAGVPQLVSGPPKSCKTLLCEHLALCVASGVRWLGRFPTRRGRALVLPREDTPEETARRFDWLARGLGLDASQLDDWLRVEPERGFRFDDAADVAAMHELLADWKPALVIIDPLSEAHRRQENDATELAPVMAAWAELCARHNTAITCIHHWRKPPEGGSHGRGVGARLRGSTRIHQRVRHLLGVEQFEDGVVRIETEGNLPASARPFRVLVADGQDAVGKPCVRVTYAKAEDD
jgi:hypothetical protein